MAQIGQSDGKNFVSDVRRVGVHKCTDEDYERFHKLETYQKKIFEMRKKENFLYCLDRTDTFGNPINL